MKVEIFGSGCPKCNAMEKMVFNTLAGLDISADVTKIKDIKEMVRRSIMLTPALFVNGVKRCEGRLPSAAELQQWLKEG